MLYGQLAELDEGFVGAPDAYARRQLDLAERLLALPQGGEVLDLGCGAGRHAILLAERGYQVTGVDVDPALIERARARWSARHGAAAGPRFEVGDMRAPPAEGPFDAAIMMDVALGVFDDDADHLRTLGAVVDRLRDRGRLLIELYNPYYWAANARTVHYPPGALLPDGDLVRTYRFDALRGRVEDRVVVFDADGRRAMPTQSLRSWTPPEILNLVQAAGFSEATIHGTDGWQPPEDPLPLDPGRSVFMWVVATL